MNNSVVANAWNQRLQDTPVPTKFWQVPEIVEHINQKIIGQPLRGAATGFHRHIATHGPFGRAVSIGCGLAGKEIDLLKKNVVEHFFLFDLAEDRIERAKNNLSATSLAGRATFAIGDPLNHLEAAEYDLVYWNSSLHHMSSARQAIEWSWHALRPGGWFAMHEYVGPTRFQWTERNMRFMNDFLAAVPDELLQVPGRPGTSAARRITRASIDQMISRDPSEAADSISIIPNLLTYFPHASPTMLGGSIYHVGLRPILPNIKRLPYAMAFLRCALLLDDALSNMGENHFAFCIVQKLYP